MPEISSKEPHQTSKLAAPDGITSGAPGPSASVASVAARSSPRISLEAVATRRATWWRLIS